MNHLAMNVGQSHVATAESEGAASVVDSQQMQNGRVQIMHLGAVLYGFVAPLIGSTINHAGYNAASRQPNCKTELIVVSTIITLSERSS